MLLCIACFTLEQALLRIRKLPKMGFAEILLDKLCGIRDPLLDYHPVHIFKLIFDEKHLLENEADTSVSFKFSCK